MRDERWERDRQEREQAFGDAVYDVWRSGGNPDLVFREDVADGWYESYQRDEAAEYAARKAMRRSALDREAKG